MADDNKELSPEATGYLTGIIDSVLKGRTVAEAIKDPDVVSADEMRATIASLHTEASLKPTL